MPALLLLNVFHYTYLRDTPVPVEANMQFPFIKMELYSRQTDRQARTHRYARMHVHN